MLKQKSAFEVGDWVTCIPDLSHTSVKYEAWVSYIDGPDTQQLQIWTGDSHQWVGIDHLVGRVKKHKDIPSPVHKIPPVETEVTTKVISDGGLVKVSDFPLEYDPISGNFYWTEQRGNYPKGCQAGNLNLTLGYWQIRCYGVLYYSHRLAFLAMEGSIPSCVVDHIDRDGTNNCWDNLRKATMSENLFNTSAPKNNTSGHKGICYATKDRVWVFRAGNQVRSSHKTLEEAIAFKESWAKDKEFYCE